MVIDTVYLAKIFKRITVFAFTCLGVFVFFKLAVFYIPFLIALIISLLVEPAIKFLNNKTNIQRKTCAIIVLLIVSVVLITILSFGIIAIISESSNLLQGLNGYIEKIYGKIQELINNIDLSSLKIPARFYRNI